MPLSFLQHTYIRRMKLMSHWYLDEMVFGEIGPNIPNTKHAINDHFKQLNGGYPNALPDSLSEIKKNWSKIISPHPTDFEDLYARVEGIINTIKGIGPLAIYDISLNIGCNLYPKVMPEKYVYVHNNCVKDSAEVMLGRKIQDNTVPATDFQNDLPMYSAMEIEDILCLYNDKIINHKFGLNDLKEVPYPIEIKVLI